MAKQTPLYDQHVACGARMVDFHGWMMPLHYGSQIDEHHAVRQDAGMFDVSHMTIVDLHGARTREFLRYLLANDVAKLTQPGKALYTGMLNASGGVIDDLIVYFLTEDYFRLVVNSATRDKDLAWIEEHAAPYGVALTVRDDLALVAVQGPQAKERAGTLFTPEQKNAVEGMKPFFGVQAGDLFIATTGYTGEAGYEIALPKEQVAKLGSVGSLNAEQPALAVRIAVDQLRRALQRIVGRDDFTADRGINVGSGFHRLSNRTVFTSGNGRAHIWQVDKHHVTQQFLRVFGNAYNIFAIACVTHPLMGCCILQFSWHIAHRPILLRRNNFPASFTP